MAARPERATIENFMLMMDVVYREDAGIDRSDRIERSSEEEERSSRKKTRKEQPTAKTRKEQRGGRNAGEYLSPETKGGLARFISFVLESPQARRAR